MMPGTLDLSFPTLEKEAPGSKSHGSKPERAGNHCGLDGGPLGLAWEKGPAGGCSWGSSTP